MQKNKLTKIFIVLIFIVGVAMIFSETTQAGEENIIWDSADATTDNWDRLPGYTEGEIVINGDGSQTFTQIEASNVYFSQPFRYNTCAVNDERMVIRAKVKPHVDGELVKFMAMNATNESGNMANIGGSAYKEIDIEWNYITAPFIMRKQTWNTTFTMTGEPTTSTVT